MSKYFNHTDYYKLFRRKNHFFHHQTSFSSTWQCHMVLKTGFLERDLNIAFTVLNVSKSSVLHSALWQLYFLINTKMRRPSVFFLLVIKRHLFDDDIFLRGTKYFILWWNLYKLSKNEIMQSMFIISASNHILQPLEEDSHFLQKSLRSVLHLSGYTDSSVFL